MTAEQLQNARASAWRQTGNALLTAEDAGAWLREAGLVLFLPRTQQIAAPAGSFVEATIGAADDAPKPAAIENALDILRRLLTAGDAVALNLLGLPGDRPDFLATEETLPFLFALRGDREWKRGPRGKSSPLVVEVWKLLESEGPMTADAVKQTLGRQLTETAALRALTELWNTLRVEPVYPAGGGDTEWQTLERQHEATMAAGAAMSQGTALSALVSLYLQSAVAATESEIEAFLSPVASRSRLRDAVRGLTATRQLGVRNLGPHEHFFVEGSLPEFPDAMLADMLPEVPAPENLTIEAISESPAIGEGRKRFVAQRGAAAGKTPDRKERRSFAPRPEGAGKRPFFAREPWKEDARPRPAAGERRPSVPREGEERKPFRGKPAGEPGSERRPFSREKRAFGAATTGGERRPYKERSTADGERKPFSSDRRPPGGVRKPFGKAADGETRQTGSRGPRPGRPAMGDASGSGGARPPRRSPAGDRPFRKEGSAAPRRNSGPGEDRPARPFRPRESAEGRPFAPRDRQERSGQERSGQERPAAKRPFSPRSPRPAGPGRTFSGGSKPAERRPFVPRDGEDTGKPRTGRPFQPRESSARPSTSRPFNKRPFGGRPQGEGRRERGEGASTLRRTGAGGAQPGRFSPGSGRPARPGAPAGAQPGARRPRTAQFTSTGKPRAGAAATGRPGPRAERPAGKPFRDASSDRDGSGKPAAAKFNAGKPGGSKTGAPGKFGGARKFSAGPGRSSAGRPASPGRGPARGGSARGGPARGGSAKGPGRGPRRDG